MSIPLIIHEDRLFPAEPSARGMARGLYREVKGLPLLGPHGQADPEPIASSAAFGNAAELRATTEGPHEALVHHRAIHDVAVEPAYTLPKRAYKL